MHVALTTDSQKPAKPTPPQVATATAHSRKPRLAPPTSPGQSVDTVSTNGMACQQPRHPISLQQELANQPIMEEPKTEQQAVNVNQQNMFRPRPIPASATCSLDLRTNSHVRNILLNMDFDVSAALRALHLAAHNFVDLYIGIRNTEIDKLLQWLIFHRFRALRLQHRPVRAVLFPRCSYHAVVDVPCQHPAPLRRHTDQQQSQTVRSRCELLSYFSSSYK